VRAAGTGRDSAAAGDQLTESFIRHCTSPTGVMLCFRNMSHPRASVLYAGEEEEEEEEVMFSSALVTWHCIFVFACGGREGAV